MEAANVLRHAVNGARDFAESRHQCVIKVFKVFTARQGLNFKMDIADSATVFVERRDDSARSQAVKAVLSICRPERAERV